MYSQDDLLGLINQAADKHESLRVLQQNPSRVSAWHYAKSVFAFAAHTLARMLDQHKADLQARLLQSEVGTLKWYIDRVKEFQYGDALVVIDNIPAYAEVSAKKRIIKQASITESDNGLLQIKVVRAKESGALVALSSQQQDALDGYIQQIKFAGTRTQIITAAADIIRLNVVIERDPQVLDPKGKSLLTPTTSPALVAINEYFQQLPFDSVLYLSKLQDQIQSVIGVRDVQFQLARYRNAIQLIEKPITRKYTSYAGHLTLDADSVITYV